MNAPTLIVGLGGIGSKIALRVSTKVSDEQRKQIGFVVFDTDVNELSEIGRKNPFVHTIQTSTKLSVGEYLDIDHHSRDEWFPVNAILNSKTLTEGAGQVRAISRLAFETAVRAGKMDELHKAIEELYKLEGNKYDQALRVIIVSTLAGGTGSGLILPVALYIKNYLATHFRQSANITRGFFLLPEILYEVIPGTAERNNLKSNAYATLKELDAFMMKGDMTLPERYADSVKIDFPCVGTDEFEQYDIRPFDFCFLFDAQNADGKKLNSFEQYIDHAANCIYAQSIGPMNKRSNSSEDNTIRKLTAERGRNRYAGAGTSMLIYPTEDIKRYIALSWTSQSVSDQWLVFDRMFNQRKREIGNMRAQGLRVQDISEAKYYIETIDQMAKDNDGFAKALVNACTQFDETGYERLGTKWDAYVAALVDKVQSDSIDGPDYLDAQRDSAELAVGALRSDDPAKLFGKKSEIWDDYASTYRELLRYRGMVEKYVNESAHTVAYTMFRAPVEDIVKKKEAFHLETYLRDDEGRFIHPTAVRYFLYKTSALFKAQRTALRQELSELKDFFDGFERANFDDPKTEENYETVDELAKTKKIRLTDKIRRRLSSDQEDLIGAYATYLQKTDELRVNSVLKEVLDEGVNYIDAISVAFEKFFRTFDDKISSVQKELRGLEKKYSKTKGMAARYVCASQTCLQGLLNEMPYTGSFISIDNKLAEDIYTRVRSYAMLSRMPEEGEFFGDIFDHGILEYFMDQVTEIYQEKIDIDIIDAIENEALYESGIMDSERLRQNTIDVINECKILAAPFIEKPLGEEKDPINSCAYNDKLNPQDDSPKALLIDAELKNFGGTEDEDIPKNMILFYKSFYGLRANDLSKFAPPQTSLTYSRTAGEYYKAYMELIEKIHPDPQISKVITPHIDRWWHVANKMPDLDDANQALLEENINAAFFWGLVCRYVDLFDVGVDEKGYLLKEDELNMDESARRLIVSNGTPCDRLYEVMDALAIYPELVSRIMARVNYLIQEEVDSNVEPMDGFLMANLAQFRVKEYPLSEDNRVRSIFDLPLLIKKSLLVGDYYEENVIRVLKVELEEIRRYFSRFLGEQELPNAVGKVVMDQFAHFLADLNEEEECWKDIYHDHLFSRTLGVIAKFLEEMGLKQDVAMVRAKEEELTR